MLVYCMELGAIIQQIMKLPARAQLPLLQGLKLNQATHTPDGAVLVAMHILVALGLPQRIDFVLGELHTPLYALRKSWADGKKSVPSSEVIPCLLVADMLAYPKRITRVFLVEELAELWHTDKLLGIDPTVNEHLVSTENKYSFTYAPTCSCIGVNTC